MPSSRRPTRRRAPRGAAAASLLLAAAALAPRAAAAQSPGAPRFGRPQPELRADAIVAAERQAYQLGAGVLWPVGRALRVGGVVAGGPADGTGLRRPGLSWRAELVAHFVLHTGPTWRRQLYAGAGAGALSVDDGARGSDPRALAHLLVGVEGSGTGWEHAVEVGIGGGVRLGVALRRAR